MNENLKVENKSEKFKRIAAIRTQKILNYIRLIGNCSNKSVYFYTEKDVSKIFNKIEKELKDVKNKFENKKNKKFSL